MKMLALYITLCSLMKYQDEKKKVNMDEPAKTPATQ